MDNFNIESIIPVCPKDHFHKVSLFLDYSEKYEETEVPDPYYGGVDGFDRVIDLIEDASIGLLNHIMATKK